MNMTVGHAVAATLLALHVAGAWAHGDAQGKANRDQATAVETAFGKAADPAKASRTVKVTMKDTMRFSPDKLHVKRGETVRFIVSNAGATMHELVLGTMANLREHAELMRKFPGMEHDEPYMAHVAPDKTETFAWQFTRTGEFYYGCLIPGHFEAGMIGKVTVR